jgi:hypothetical protein
VQSWEAIGGRLVVGAVDSVDRRVRVEVVQCLGAGASAAAMLAASSRIVAVSR